MFRAEVVLHAAKPVTEVIFADTAEEIKADIPKKAVDLWQKAQAHGECAFDALMEEVGGCFEVHLGGVIAAAEDGATPVVRQYWG